jgi:hypothetical protein
VPSRLRSILEQDGLGEATGHDRPFLLLRFGQLARKLLLKAMKVYPKDDDVPSGKSASSHDSHRTEDAASN